jgi:hypothetical protein
MRSQAEIEKSIRGSLPILFRTADAVDGSKLREKYNELVDHAAAVSEPFLRAETVRYQSILLYVSLLFLAVRVFRVSHLIQSGNEIPLDGKFLGIYSTFIAAVIVIFSLKAYVDYQRSRFVWSKTDDLVHQARELIMCGVLTMRVQQYFWQELVDLIGRSFKAYQDALAIAHNEPSTSTYIAVQSLTLDPVRDLPDLAREIAVQEKNLAKIAAELAQDEMGFNHKSQALFKASADQRPHQGPALRPEHIRGAFDQCLSNWLEARSALSLALLRKQDGTPSPEERKLTAIVEVVKRMHNIRRTYRALEVLCPVVFAVVAILYVWRSLP